MKEYFIVKHKILVNGSIFNFYNLKTKETTRFLIDEHVSEFKELITFLKSHNDTKSVHISFDGLNSEAQITQYCIEKRGPWSKDKPEKLALKMFLKHEDGISRLANGEFMEYYEYNMNIDHLDLKRLNGWNAKDSIDLAYVDIYFKKGSVDRLRFNSITSFDDNLEEIKLLCDQEISTIARLLEYNGDDVKNRMKISKEYDVNCNNMSSANMSSEVLLRIISDKVSIPINVLKKKRTYREDIVCRDFVPEITFKNINLNRLKDLYSNLTVNSAKLKNSFNYTATIGKTKVVFGLGGVHGAAVKGAYESDDDKVIISLDVVSFYANLAVNNVWAPEHINDEFFVNCLESILEKKDNTKGKERQLYKNILTYAYGGQNSEYSYLYDTEVAVKTAINGQLIIAKLVDSLMSGSFSLLLINTDGLEFSVRRDELTHVESMIEQWEKDFNLKLKYKKLKKLIIQNVNNYISVSEDDKVNTVGKFNFEKLDITKEQKPDIIYKAIYEHFVNNVDPRRTINKCLDSSMFCYTLKVKPNATYMQVEGSKHSRKEVLITNSFRYYISKLGGSIVEKEKEKEKEKKIEKVKELIVPLYDLKEKVLQEKPVDKNHYTKAAFAIIYSIEGNKQQLNLF